MVASGTLRTSAFGVRHAVVIAVVLVALIWAAVFYILGPSNGEYPSQAAVLHYLGHTPLLPITAPVALLGRHYAITWVGLR